MDPVPYNVTISSRAASILYSPVRDTSLDKGWNVTYSNGLGDVGGFGKAGVGVGSHSTTTAGATMRLSWVGTAIFLYGESAKATSYEISVDGVDVFGSSPSGSPLEPGLLGSKTGLPYGSHTAELTVVGGDKVRFQHAIVTIGMGYQESTTPIQYRNVYAVVPDSSDQLVQNDNFFTFNRAPGSGLECDWVIGNIYPADIVPEPVPRQVVTPCGNRSDSVVFRVNQTSAFFLFGALYFDHQWKTVTMKPGLNGDSSKITQFNDFSRITDINQTLYWESGLDRDQEYEVEIVINVNDGKNIMSFHTLELIDGGPKPVTTNSFTPSPSPSPSPSSPGLKAGAIAGIVVGVVLLFFVSLTAAWWIWRRRRIDRAAELRQLSLVTVFDRDVSGLSKARSPFWSKKQETSHSPSSSTASSSTGVGSRIINPPNREVDAGPVDFSDLLPPEYDHSWLLRNNPAQDLSRSGAGTRSRGLAVLHLAGSNTK